MCKLLISYRGAILIFPFMFLLISCSSSNDSRASIQPAISEQLAPILNADHRSDANKARDQYRHPASTLEWFEVESDMTVVEIFPGGGWYTEILAPYLKDRGRLYAAGTDPKSLSSFSRNSAQLFQAKMASNSVYKNVIVTVLAPPEQLDIAPPESADRVLTFRNIHNWMKAGTAEHVFAAMYRALKPGGILGVVEHQGNPDVPQDPKASNGYVNKEYAIKLAEKTGFLFMGASNINGNPKDTKDYPKGVWTLPPTFAMKDVDRAKYEAIGESDRFTMKFMKPLN